MSTISPQEYHLKFKNMLREQVTRRTVTGAAPLNDWVILEAILDEPLFAMREKRSKILRARNEVDKTPLTANTKHSQPIVFQVLAVGPKVTGTQVGNFVSFSHMAGDQFAASPIVTCREDDIVFNYGIGLELTPEEIIAKLNEVNELAQFFQDEEKRNEERARIKAKTIESLSSPSGGKREILEFPFTPATEDDEILKMFNETKIKSKVISKVVDGEKFHFIPKDSK